MTAGIAGAALKEALAEAGPASAVSFASLRVLILEDESSDAELAMCELRRSWRTVDWRRVDTEPAFRSALEESWDVILSDYNVPQFDGPAAIRLARSLTPQIPVIVLTGQIGEELAAGCIRDGAVVIDEYHRADGKTLFFHVVKSPVFDSDHRITGTQGIVVDITEHRQAEAALRESEERFRQIAENITEVFWMTDPRTGTMLYVSPAYVAIWGRSRESLYESPQRWLEAIHPEERERVRAAAQTQADGLYDESYRIVRPDGSQRWIRDRAFPIRNQEGRVYRMVGTAEDITDRRRLEEQFREAQKLEAIGTLAGGIAHDFNNILTAISGFAELAKLTSEGNREACEHIDSVLTASWRAASLVRQILSFSRRDDQQRHPVQLNQALVEPLKLLRATIPSIIEFDIELAPNLPSVLADTTQIHQGVLNRGTNAWQAMKPRAGRLHVQLAKVEVDALMAGSNPRLREGEYVRLTVTDTGRGMDRETQARIFEPFFTTKPPGEGTGLGLSVAHGIILGHDGAITVYSELGRGTTFHVYFPVHAAESFETVEGPANVPRGRGERVLFVDDEKPLAELGHRMLEHLGYEVESTSSVLAALDRVRADPRGFALVITDLTMPVMTGLDFAVELLALRPDLPIILTTGFNAGLTAARVRELGIRELLLKPHSLQSLGVAAHRALTESKLG